MNDLRFPFGEFPVKSLFVPCYFVRSGTLSLCKLHVSVDLQRVRPSERVKFPVNFPVNCGDEFALDYLLRHSVWIIVSRSRLLGINSILRPKRLECHTVEAVPYPPIAP